MGELDDYEGEDWKGWLDGKYDNRYQGTRRQNRRYNNYKNKASKKKKISSVFVCLIVCFCVISISGTILLDSNDYTDVELSMMFYYNILIGIIYEDEIQKDILSFDKEKLFDHIDEKGTLVKEELKNKRIEDMNHRIQEDAKREKVELAKKQEIEREYELLIHAYTNGERVKYGLEPLHFSEDISKAARMHSQDMLDNDFFEHDNLRGQTPTDRGNSIGISCVKDYGSYYTEGLSENIFYMEGYGVSNVAENSKTIVEGWMESKGHRENILEKDYDRIGIGIKFANDEIYATQNFC